jgi:UDP-N-acetylmuramoylalanine--D-glutamate ligase
MTTLDTFATSWQHLHVLVLGLGESGLAMARWCAARGAQVQVADSREAPPQAEALARELPQVTVHRGFDPALLGGDVLRVLKSPGLSPLDPLIAPLLARAAELGITVHNELDLFAEALAELKAGLGYAPKVIAITGTNGKTTTTMMCGHLVERSGARVAVAGNVGPTMLGTLAEALTLELRDATPPPTPAEMTVPAAAAIAALSEDAEALDPEPAAEAGDAATDQAQVEALADESDETAPLHLVPPPPRAPVFSHLPEVWVLELSSFQLDGVERFEPTAAVVLNLSQDHLDWHGSMARYGAAKARVYGPADRSATLAIVNRDDAAAAALVPQPEPAPVGVRGSKARPRPLTPRREIRFGLGAPQRPGDYGLVVENGMAWMVRAMDAEVLPRRRRGDAAVAEEPLSLQRLMPADALRIRGRHNVGNALAALALATAVGRPLAPMLHGLREYRGEPHRVEYIASVDGVEAFDDSKGTNVGATVAALDGLGAERGPGRLLVILGGVGKGQDFAPLAQPLARWARGVALIGRDAGAIEAAVTASITAAGVPLTTHASLDAAVQWCFAQARSGDAVLLSPACASFDMFTGYAHRAQVFADAVRSLAAERGVAA